MVWENHFIKTHSMSGAATDSSPVMSGTGCCPLCWCHPIAFTFGLQSVGVEMHPLLALGAAHQEPGHSFSWEKGIGLCNLEKQREGCMACLRA